MLWVDRYDTYEPKGVGMAYPVVSQVPPLRGAEPSPGTGLLVAGVVSVAIVGVLIATIAHIRKLS